VGACASCISTSHKTILCSCHMTHLLCSNYHSLFTEMTLPPEAQSSSQSPDARSANWICSKERRGYQWRERRMCGKKGREGWEKERSRWKVAFLALFAPPHKIVVCQFLSKNFVKYLHRNGRYERILMQCYKIHNLSERRTDKHYSNLGLLLNQKRRC